jgi:hypothetical protein
LITLSLARGVAITETKFLSLLSAMVPSS